MKGFITVVCNLGGGVPLKHGGVGGKRSFWKRRASIDLSLALEVVKMLYLLQFSEHLCIFGAMEYHSINTHIERCIMGFFTESKGKPFSG
jgi:hypothetical protein